MLRLFLMLEVLLCGAVMVDGRQKISHSAMNRSWTGLPKTKKPNIVLIITDDQDVELGSLNFMPKLQKILRDGGAEFTNAFVTTPICCPSRSSMLTGLYVHNHGVHTNNENCSNSYWQETFENATFATYLSNSGYRTGYFGKYLNEYNGSYIPSGWREWMGLVKNSRFFNYTVNFNGQKIKHNDVYHEDYFTDLITNDSLAFLKRSRRLFPNRPVLMVLSMPAPHGPEDPAPQYRNWFRNATTHRTKSYNYAPNPDKQWLLQRTGKMEPVHVAFTDFLQRRRLQTLQSVDEAIERIYNELIDLGELESTYILYTSDHGYHLGQFGLIKGKNMPYEFDIKVPFLVRGPGILPRTRIWRPVLNIDIAPTLLEIGGITPPDSMDGQSIMRILKHEFQKATAIDASSVSSISWRHTFLVERGKIRPKLLRRKERLLQQKAQYGKEMRIQKECQKEEYQLPCKAFQQWECRRNEVGRWRIFKCRGNVIVDNFCDCEENKKGEEDVGQDDLNSDPETGIPFRHLKRSRRSVNEFKIEVSPLFSHTYRFSEWENDRSSSSDALFVDEETIGQWESEFYQQIMQDEIIRNGEWYQGIFDAVEDFSSPRAIKKRPKRAKSSRKFSSQVTSNQTLSNQGKLVAHKHRNLLKEFRHEQKSGVIVIKGCRLFKANSSILCRPKVYHNISAWRDRKNNIERQIRLFRSHIESLKDIRNHLKIERPLDDESKNWKEETAAVGEDEEEEFLFDIKDLDLFDVMDSNTVSDLTQNLSKNGCDCALQSSSKYFELPSSNDDRLIAAVHPLKRTKATGDKWQYVNDFDLEGAEDFERDEFLAETASKINNNRLDKEARRKIKLERKQQRLEKQEKKNRRLQQQDKVLCNIPSMNCFTHDNSHWRTPPYWTLGPFCFCQNSNNNTYWCLRTINRTHNFLYCEFVTGFISYYNIKEDPYQLKNAVYQLDISVLEQLGRELDLLRSCRGATSCNSLQMRKNAHRESVATSGKLTDAPQTTMNKQDSVMSLPLDELDGDNVAESDVNPETVS